MVYTVFIFEYMGPAGIVITLDSKSKSKNNPPGVAKYSEATGLE